VFFMVICFFMLMPSAIFQAVRFYYVFCCYVLFSISYLIENIVQDKIG